MISRKTSNNKMSIITVHLPRTTWLMLLWGCFVVLVFNNQFALAAEQTTCDETCRIKHTETKEDIIEAEVSALKAKIGLRHLDSHSGSDEKHGSTYAGLRDDVVDLIVDQLAAEVAERVMEQFPRSLAERIQQLEEDEDYDRYLAELEDEERLELERVENELKGCPSSLDDIVLAAVVDGGNCDTLQSWSNCNKTLLYYSKYADELDLGCDQPLIFEHGMTLFCEESRPISEYYDIRCYHRELYRD